jgi:hypothetical protein
MALHPRIESFFGFCSLQNKTLPEKKHELPNFVTLIVSEKVDSAARPRLLLV